MTPNTLKLTLLNLRSDEQHWSLKKCPNNYYCTPYMLTNTRIKELRTYELKIYNKTSNEMNNQMIKLIY